MSKNSKKQVSEKIKGDKKNRRKYSVAETADNTFVLQEPAAAYNTANSILATFTAYRGGQSPSNVSKKSVGQIFSGKKFAKIPSEMSAFEKMEILRQGLSKSNLIELKEKSGLGYDQLANVLSVARATLINKKGVATFGQELSEKILSLADIYSYGYTVFGNENSFNEWVILPNNALGGIPPLQILNNQFGREEVRNLIGRIQYGVYS